MKIKDCNEIFERLQKLDVHSQTRVLAGVFGFLESKSSNASSIEIQAVFEKMDEIAERFRNEE